MNKAAQSLGRLGGKAGTGAAKARTSELEIVSEKITN